MVNMDRLRIDYVLVRRWWKDAEGWTEEDLAEADRGIKAAVDANDDGVMLMHWTDWIEKLAEEIRRFESMVRDAEGRMRERAAAERKAA